MINFKRPDGKEISGYYVGPPKASAPGVVVIQEWWGLNDQIKGVAEHLSLAGYRALVPDLYRGKIAVEAKEAEHLMGDLNFGDAAGQDIRGAVQHLRTGSSKVAVMGFCMGGALTLLSAVNVPEAHAAVAWYGFPPLDYIDATKIKIPCSDISQWTTHSSQLRPSTSWKKTPCRQGSLRISSIPGKTRVRERNNDKRADSRGV